MPSEFSPREAAIVQEETLAWEDAFNRAQNLVTLTSARVNRSMWYSSLENNHK